MTGIQLAAIITTLAVLALWGNMIRRIRSPASPWLLLLSFLIVLPMEPLSFYWFRLPLDAWLKTHLANDGGLYQFLRLCYAPLTEEPFKLWPLLLPSVRRHINRENFVRFALAIGLGFGIGEIWLVAHFIAQDPNLGHFPFYYYTGFAVERMEVCLLHAGFTAVALWQLHRRFPLGFAGACVLHFCGNLPIFLMAKNFGGLGKDVWQVIVGLWVGFYFIAMAALLSYFLFRKKTALGRLLFGCARCPGCGFIYPRSLWGFNLGLKRYERCPSCRRWHMTGAADVVPEELVP